MRTTKEITIQDNGNDIVFRITEMPATKLERFLIRLGVLLGGGAVSNNVSWEGIAGLLKDSNTGVATAVLQSLQGVDCDKAFDLIDELYTCAQQRVGNAYIQVTPDNIDSMLGSIQSLVTLQKEIIALNASFFTKGGALSGSASQKKEGTTFNMRTSQTM